ncbi:MAG TPA: amidohydrolase [Microbacteriaceae bacterium]|nr:amidohydrolase [Microbacteriaceae bacterium]
MTIDLESLYKHFHQNPELSFQEFNTAKILTDHLHDLGFQVVDKVGGTGILGIFKNGDGPCVWMRADMDALPVQEQSGKPYASKAMGVDRDGQTVSIMHACGHDMHMTAMIGFAETMVSDLNSWAGTLVIVFQPAEELGAGARAMLDDGALNKAPKPDIVLGQHLSPVPAGTVRLHAGTQNAGCDTLRVTLHGRGGHGSRPHTTVDPVVMAAAVVMRLQTVVSRHINPLEMAVVTVGAMHAGLKDNIIGDEATLEISIRYAKDEVRSQLINHITRIVNAEAEASGAETSPTIEILETLPPTINDKEAANRLFQRFEDTFGIDQVSDPGMSPGSEDVSWFARDAGVPLVFWYWGGWDAAEYLEAEQKGTVDRDIPTNHSPFMAPVIHPTIETGVRALEVAAKEFLQL